LLAKFRDALSTLNSSASHVEFINVEYYANLELSSDDGMTPHNCLTL
jgi:hypothetical protein